MFLPVCLCVWLFVRVRASVLTVTQKNLTFDGIPPINLIF